MSGLFDSYKRKAFDDNSKIPNFYDGSLIISESRADFISISVHIVSRLQYNTDIYK